MLLEGSHDRRYSKQEAVHCAFRPLKEYLTIKATAVSMPMSLPISILATPTNCLKICQYSCFFTNCASYASESSLSGGRVLHAVSLSHYSPIS
jgi:hypothetical protein